MTALLTLNGSPVVSAQIRLPRVGVWSADLTIDTDIDPPVLSTIATDDNSWSLVGTCKREGIFLDNVRVRMWGGAGRLNDKLAPKAYNGFSVKSVLSDLLDSCGEKLSGATDATILSKWITRWCRMGGTGKSAIQALMNYAGADAWRILPDGTFWSTTSEKWPLCAPTDFEVSSRSYAENWITLQSERPFLLPGQSLKMPDSVDGDIVRADNLVILLASGTCETRIWVRE